MTPEILEAEDRMRRLCDALIRLGIELKKEGIEPKDNPTFQEKHQELNRLITATHVMRRLARSL